MEPTRRIAKMLKVTKISALAGRAHPPGATLAVPAGPKRRAEGLHMSDGDTSVERETEPGTDLAAEELLAAHPAEAAEGPRVPGEDAAAPLPPHPDEPAEGER